MNGLAQEKTATGEKLIALTMDDSLVATLEAVAPDHPLGVLASEADLPEFLLAQKAGVVIIDTAALGSSPVARLTERLAAQFPDLVIIVAGNSQDQGALSAQITRGAVYRFLHKPASTQRVRLFVDAAFRRHEEEKAPDTALRAKTGQSPEPGLSRGTLLIGACVVVAIVGGALWYEMRPRSEPVVVQPIVINQDSTVIAPTPADARESARADSEASAAAEAASRLEPLLARIEQALLANRIDDAERLLADAREIDSSNLRVSLLTAQIKRERERAVVSAARDAAASGNIDKALGVLEDPKRTSARDTGASPARQDFTQQLSDRVGSLLRLADERIREGALIEPAQNNARYYVESAAAIAPDDAEVREAERKLAAQLLARGRAALGAGNVQQGETLLAAATDAGVPADEIAATRKDIARQRTTAGAVVVPADLKEESYARILKLFNLRLSQRRLTQPQDSARFYLAQLEQANAGDPSTRAARIAFSAQLLEEARGAAERGDLVAAQSYVTEARRYGASGAMVAAVERKIAASRDPGSRTARVDIEPISAGRLERTRYVPPEYPTEARDRSLSGSVELTFTVQADGRVANVSVENATPPKIFDEAAIAAVSKWRYKPYERNGVPVDQRVKLILRFAME